MTASESIHRLCITPGRERTLDPWYEVPCTCGEAALLWRSVCQRWPGEAVARTVGWATASCRRDGDRCVGEVSVS